MLAFILEQTFFLWDIFNTISFASVLSALLNACFISPIVVLRLGCWASVSNCLDYLDVLFSPGLLEFHLSWLFNSLSL